MLKVDERLQQTGAKSDAGTLFISTLTQPVWEYPQFSGAYTSSAFAGSTTNSPGGVARKPPGLMRRSPSASRRRFAAPDASYAQATLKL
ncbi:MAG: hypothetical protein ACR2G4_02240 [Pyrinomonadaceae bacterium]